MYNYTYRYISYTARDFLRTFQLLIMYTVVWDERTRQYIIIIAIVYQTSDTSSLKIISSIR